MEAEEKAETDNTVKITKRDDSEDMTERAEKDEAEYIEKDVILKFQINYDHSVRFPDKFPEAFHI